jgi:hypothetical protein
MARRKLLKEHIRNIQRTRGSYHISIPVILIHEFGWKERQKVNVKKMGNKIVISDWKK